MNILNRIIRRLCAECTWAKLGAYTQFVYYKRKPLLEYNISNRGRPSENLIREANN